MDICMDGQRGGQREQIWEGKALENEGEMGWGCW